MSEDELIKENLPLVRFVINRFFTFNSNDYEDVLQTGLIGLLKGIRGYDKSKGALSTFCATCIRRTISKDYFRPQNTQKRKGPPCAYLDSYINEESGEMYTKYLVDKTVDIEKGLIIRTALKMAILENGDMAARIANMKLLGKSQTEIGKELGVSQVTISRHVTRIRRSYENMAM